MGLEDELDEFIEKSGVDSRAGDALKAEAEDVKREVMQRGDLTDCRNPSAALMSRIKVAKENLSAKSSGGGGGSSIVASRERSRSPRRSGGGGGGGPTKDELEGFISDNKIDDSAADQLRECDGPVQKQVMERGSLTDCRNPSAVCLGRIRDAKNGIRANPVSAPPGPVVAVDPTRPMTEVERFIVDNRLDHSASTSLRSEKEDVQKMFNSMNVNMCDKTFQNLMKGLKTSGPPTRSPSA